MKDWKGNEIQVGDTIVLVSTKSQATESSLILMDFSSNEPPQVLSTHKEESKYQWVVLSSYLITKHRGRLYLTFDDNGITSNYGIETLSFFLSDSDIICIKGKSDNETEYYQHYFNHE